MKRDRIPKLLHGVISTFLRDNFPLETIGVLVTVTEVWVSPDGLLAKVALSFMDVKTPQSKHDKAVKAVMAHIEAEKNALKRYVSHQLGKTLRRIPDIVFVRDRSAVKASRIASLLATSSHEKDEGLG